MRRPALALILIALVTAAPRAQQPEATLTGRVTSDAGAPIADAQVGLFNMGLNTVTKADGSYKLIVPAARANGQQATLMVRLLGFKPKSVLVTLKPGPQNVDFVLPPQAVVLQQVVITGEGIITTNEKLGETVNTVQGEQLVNSNETNLASALSAKAPNVLIQSQSGDPASSTNIQIRGLKTFSGDGQPLFVVDGVPVDNSTISTQSDPSAGNVAPNRIADINTNDIESVTILKGAAASAIYGARASQGVVLITTKSGKPGATRYSLSASYSANDVTQGFPLQTSYGQTTPCSFPDCNTGGSSSWGDALPAGTPTYDHFGEMFETGSLWDVTLGLSGGDERRSFYLSAGYTGNQGFVSGPADWYDRWTINLRASQIMADRLLVSARLTYATTQGGYVNRGNTVSGLMLDALRTPPDFDNRHYLDTVAGVAMHRSYRFPQPLPDSMRATRGYDNPFFDIYQAPNSSALQRFYGNIDLNWDPNEWLTLQWIPGVDYYTDARYQGWPQSTSGAPGNATGPIGGALRDDFKNLIVSSVITAVGQHTFNPDFSGSLTLGNEVNLTNYSQLQLLGDDLITPMPLVLQNTQTIVYWNDYTQQIHRQSYFGQVTAELRDQLFLTFAIRNDGYSTFSQNDPRAWYPKASAAWTFTKAVGSSGNGALQFGKIRAAYGETGKEPQPYSTLTGFTNPPYGSGLISSSTLGNDSLKPERQKELEAGFDLGFFGGFADVSATAYSSNASNVIVALPLPASSGAFFQVQNAASVQNKGIEVQLNLNSPAGTKTVQWSLGFLWAMNRNLVTALGSGVNQVFLGGFSPPFPGAVARVGYPVGAIDGNDFVRCGQGATLNNISLDESPTCAGQPKGALYIDTNGFPLLDDSLRIIGNSQPDWTGAIHGSVTLRGKLQLSFLVDIRHGGQAWNGTKGALYYYGTHKDTEIRGQTRTFGVDYFPGPVVGPGQGTAVVIDQGWYQGLGSPYGGPSSQFIENSGFTKLREIALQYTWDGPWITQHAGLSSVTLRLAGRNLATWTGYSGIDPENNLWGAGLIQGIDWFNNPQTRSVVISVGLAR